MKVNELLLLSGAPIPFVEGTITMSQPTIYDISFLGEEVLFTGCELLKFTKDILLNEDKSRLLNYSDFNILLSIMNDKSGSMIYNLSCAKQVLSLLFPLYSVEITSEKIEFRNPQTWVLEGEINDQNFHSFQELLIQVLCLQKNAQQTEYNAQGELAKKIAEKFKKRQQQLAELASHKTSSKIAIFSRYISILAVGEHKDINSFMKYTVYQLFDEFERFNLKMKYDIYFKARIAGAKDLEEPQDWMKDIHDEDSKRK